MKNSFGSAVILTLFGESHGPAVGAVLDGLAPGLAVDEAFIAAEMEKRKGEAEVSTPRREADEVQFLSGVYKGRTTGAPLCLVIENKHMDSDAYEDAALLPRPSHADYAASQKYFGHADMRGGGHFSGRLTAPLVAAGALCRQVLSGRGITIGTHLCRCAGVDDAGLPQDEAALQRTLRRLNKKTFAVVDDAAGKKMRENILAAKAAGDSVGGVLETAVTGLAPGVGEPFFAGVESRLASLLFSIPAVKGVEFGLGFAFADMQGSQVADEFTMQNGAVRTKTNWNGGLNGGITNGMPVWVCTAIKPTSSIMLPLQTVNIGSGMPATVKTEGRHDPCIAPRARAAVDAVCAFGLLDLCSQRFGTLWQNPGLEMQ